MPKKTFNFLSINLVIESFSRPGEFEESVSCNQLAVGIIGNSASSRVQAGAAKFDWSCAMLVRQSFSWPPTLGPLGGGGLYRCTVGGEDFMKLHKDPVRYNLPLVGGK